MAFVIIPDRESTLSAIKEYALLAGCSTNHIDNVAAYINKGDGACLIVRAGECGWNDRYRGFQFTKSWFNANDPLVEDNVVDFRKSTKEWSGAWARFSTYVMSMPAKVAPAKSSKKFKPSAFFSMPAPLP